MFISKQTHYLILGVYVLLSSSLLDAAYATALGKQAQEAGSNKSVADQSVVKSLIDAPLQMPSEKVLRANMNANGLEHFMERTSIIKEIANLKASPVQVLSKVETCLWDYREVLMHSYPLLAQSTQLLRWTIVEVILKDHHAAFEQLKDAAEKGEREESDKHLSTLLQNHNETLNNTRFNDTPSEQTHSRHRCMGRSQSEPILSRVAGK